MRKVYISGPMTGYENFNYPAFFKAEQLLKNRGYEVENPASNPEQETWEDYMKVALIQMLKCDVVVLLQGWEKSKGATEEVRISELLGIRVRTLDAVLEDRL